jgi:hypothetical protein
LSSPWACKVEWFNLLGNSLGFSSRPGLLLATRLGHPTEFTIEFFFGAATYASTPFHVSYGIHLHPLGETTGTTTLPLGMGLLHKVSTWHENFIIPVIQGLQGCGPLTVPYGNFGQERDTNSSNDLQSARPSTLPR